MELRTIGQVGISHLSPSSFFSLMKVTPGLVERMIDLKKRGVSIQSIANELGVCSRTVNKYTRWVKHPNNRKYHLIFVTLRLV